jgi:hypothetical protein
MRIISVAALVAAGVLAGSIAAGPAAAQSACTDLGGTVTPDGVCAVHATNPTYTLDMSFPNDYPDQQALTAYLTQTRDGFINVSQMPGSWNLPYQLDAKGTGYHAGPPTGGTQSVVFEVYQNVGGAHPQTFYQAFNWDNVKRTPITFDTLFKPGSDPVAVLDPIVKAALKNQPPGAPVNENLIGADMYKSFALTDAVIFYIGQGMWAIEAAGPQQVSVPRREFASILA